MATLREYFESDIKGVPLDQTLTFTNQRTGGETNLTMRIVHEMSALTAVVMFYIPETATPISFCRTILTEVDQLVAKTQVQVVGGFDGDISAGEPQTIYSRRVFFYTETEMSADEIVLLEKLAVENGRYATVRGPAYVAKRMTLEKPVAFVSHDSRDKDLIARPLAQGLSSRLCPVWYDEYSLKIGDSLRESIEKGIKEVKKCVLVLTPNFLDNPGWTKREFSSIFTREMIMDERIILPIWHGVTKEDVYEYSPSLADTVALVWPSSDGLSDDEYKQRVQKLISKVHTAITG